jgi:hypothetical protein
MAKPGDGRPQPTITAQTWLWARLRECGFLGMEQIVPAAVWPALDWQQSFGNDMLNYFVERLDPASPASSCYPPEVQKWLPWAV